MIHASAVPKPRRSRRGSSSPPEQAQKRRTLGLVVSLAAIALGVVWIVLQRPRWNLEARLQRVQPLVEEILGEDLGAPVRLRTGTKEEWIAEVMSKGRTCLFLGHADTNGVRLIDDMGQEFGDLADEYVDQILAHQLVHVFQDRQGIHGSAGVGESDETGEARYLLREGHAHLVARTVGERLNHRFVFNWPRDEDGTPSNQEVGELAVLKASARGSTPKESTVVVQQLILNPPSSPAELRRYALGSGRAK